jgi:hypothetical protein
MDASQITKLKQLQSKRYINRNACVDASTLIWQNQIRSSKYIQGVAKCDGSVDQNAITNSASSDKLSGIRSFGGSGKSTTLMTGSTQQYPNVLAGARGSASQVYSVEHITLQRAGKQACAIPGTTTDPQNMSVILPTSDYLYTNTNGPCTANNNSAPVNNMENPYLPAFDTYYKFKNPPSSTQSSQDKNLQHFVKQYSTRFPNTTSDTKCLNC